MKQQLQCATWRNSVRATVRLANVFESQVNLANADSVRRKHTKR